MATPPIRVKGGRFENAERAYERAVEAQRQQLVRLFAAAGLPAQPLLWGHSGVLGIDDLVRLVNFAGRSRTQIDVVDPADYGVS